MQILVATHNRGKLTEFQELIGQGAEVVSLQELGLPSPVEDGATFEENATIKARAAAVASGLVSVADDSGLEVDALNGAPGIHSARYSGEDATDESNRLLLLRRLERVLADSRTGRFVSVVAVCTPDGTCRTYRGEWDGRVALAARGDGGFGYDSVFELPDGQTVAELSAKEKNARSHRAKAFALALPLLQELLAASAVTGSEDRR